MQGGCGKKKVTSAKGILGLRLHLGNDINTQHANALSPPIGGRCTGAGEREESP